MFEKKPIKKIMLEKHHTYAHTRHTLRSNPLTLFWRRYVAVRTNIEAKLSISCLCDSNATISTPTQWEFQQLFLLRCRRTSQSSLRRSFRAKQPGPAWCVGSFVLNGNNFFRDKFCIDRRHGYLPKIRSSPNHGRVRHACKIFQLFYTISAHYETRSWRSQPDQVQQCAKQQWRWWKHASNLIRSKW